MYCALLRVECVWTVARSQGGMQKYYIINKCRHYTTHVRDMHAHQVPSDCTPSVECMHTCTCACIHAPYKGTCLKLHVPTCTCTLLAHSVHVSITYMYTCIHTHMYMYMYLSRLPHNYSECTCTCIRTLKINTLG